MPKLNIPWWGYLIIAAIIILLFFVGYKRLTRYQPSKASFNQTESALPEDFDANAEGENAANVLSETLGLNDANLIEHLNEMTDNELIAVYNAYNMAHYSDKNQTLTARLQAIDTIPSAWWNFGLGTDTGTKRDDLVKRMQTLNLP